MKKIILVAVMIVMFAMLSGCSLDPEEMVDNALETIADMMEEAVEEKIDEKKQEATNLWGKKIGCDHEPSSYKAEENTVTCKCGAYTYADLEYAEFVDCIPFLKSFNREKYYVEAYIQYKGVDPIYTKFASMLPTINAKAKNIEGQLEEYEGCLGTAGSALETVKFYGELVDDSEAVELIESTAEFTGTLGNAVTITKLAVKINTALENKDDPAVACDALISFVGEIAGGEIPGLGYQLEALSKALGIYWKYYEKDEFQKETWGSLLVNPDSNPIASWGFFHEPKSWDKDLENVFHLDAVYWETDKRDATDNKKYPSVEEVCIAIENDALDENGKMLASEYVMYRMNLYFEHTMGITLKEYVEYLSE